MLTDKEKIKYDRQLILPGFTNEHQIKLKNSKVLVVGAGGLGAIVLTYLTRIGIGALGIIEFDTIDETNIHRQFLYSENDINKEKIDVAIENLKPGNNFCELIPHNEKLTSENAKRIFSNYDIIADCTDNFRTRYIINDVCAEINKPLVFASVANYEGQVTILHHKNNINYRDIYDEMPDSAPTKGILPTLISIIGGIQATEVIKIITGLGENLDGKLLLYNILEYKQHILKLI